MANSYPLSYVSNNLNKIVSEFLTDYSEELQAKVDKITEQVAKDFANQLKAVTPRSQNASEEHLADTIVVTAKTQKVYGRTSKARYVHFRKWQISHLLEFGWTARNGKKITRTPFVRPLFDKNKDRYYNLYKDGLR